MNELLTNHRRTQLQLKVILIEIYIHIYIYLFVFILAGIELQKGHQGVVLKLLYEKRNNVYECLIS